MNPLLPTNALGSVGFFSSRIFLPALVMALLLRFGVHIWPLDHAPLISHVMHAPTWFTSNTSLLILAVLSTLEIVGQKNTDVRRLLHEFDVSAKGIMALLTTLGVANAEDGRFVQTMTMHAGIARGVIPGIIAVIGTVGVGRVRGQVLSTLHEMDPDDALHLQRMISWAEEAWIVFGVVLLLLSPILMLVLIGIVVAILGLIQKRLRDREEGKRVACAGCGSMIYPSATACFHCKTPLAAPRAIGVFGQTKTTEDPDPANHSLRLLEKKRCPTCAAHLRGTNPHQICPVCLTDLTPRFEHYAGFVTQRLPTVLAISALMSFVPLIGLVFGTVYYRLLLVNPFNVYLGLGDRFLLKWSIRLLFVILFFFQIVPFIGAIVVPLMALVSYTAYRAAFLQRLLDRPMPNEFAVELTSDPVPA